MKILFVDPHISSKTSAPPLNLVNIMTVCRQEGHEVERVAFEIDEQRFANLKAFGSYEREFCDEVGRRCRGCDAVGVTTTFAVLKRTGMILESAKRNNPTIRTILGGGFTHYLYMCDEWRAAVYDAFPSLDYIIVGEGERTVVDLLDKLREPAEVAGLIYRNGSVRRTGVRAFIDDLDSLPISDYAPYDMSSVNHVRVLASRGCPFRCSFCEVCVQWGGRYRVCNEDSIAREISSIQRQTGISKIRFADSTFTINPRLHQICRAIEPLGVEWVAYARVSDIAIEKLDAMKKSGCKGLYFGIESASDATLDAVNKKIDAQTIVSAIRDVQQHGIKASGTMILGFPNESADDVKRTIDFAKGLGLDGYSWHRYMVPVEHIVRDEASVKKFNWFNFETDIPYELVPELVWRCPEVSEDMHIPIILAELGETSLPRVPVNSQLSLPEFVRVLKQELAGYMSECAQQHEVRVMNSTVERMLS